MSTQKKKPSFLTIGAGYTALFLAIPMDFYAIARIHIIVAMVVVLAMGMEALLIDLGQVRAGEEDVKMLKRVFPVWFVSAAVCCVTITLQHPVFSGMPYLLVVYRVVCATGFGAWGACLATLRRMCDATL